jgi:hypothetical protein
MFSDTLTTKNCVYVVICIYGRTDGGKYVWNILSLASERLEGFFDIKHLRVSSSQVRAQL